MIDYAASHARHIGAPALTLTTFADVPWNAPYYQRCGFTAFDEKDAGPELRRLRERDRETAGRE